jgi:cytochrome c556
MRFAAAALAVVAMLVTASCGGESSASDAKAKACDARNDIHAQITKLEGVTTGDTTLDEAKTALQRISDDLDQIATEAPKATGSVNDELTAANEQFTEDLQQVKQGVASAGSVSGTVDAVSAAGQKLAASYKSAFADVGC